MTLTAGNSSQLAQALASAPIGDLTTIQLTSMPLALQTGTSAPCHPRSLTCGYQQPHVSSIMCMPAGDILIDATDFTQAPYGSANGTEITGKSIIIQPGQYNASLFCNWRRFE